MCNLFITTAIASSFAGVAFAQEAAPAGPTLSGEVSLDFAETAAGDWGGSMGVEVDVNAAGLGNVDLGFAAKSGGALTLDTWTVGTDLAPGLGVAIGNDNGVFVGAEGEQTLAAPAMTESVQVGYGPAAVALGFTDWTADITDVSNIQGSYTLGVAGMAVTAAADYNFNTENTMIGAEVGGFDVVGLATVGGAMTYDFDAENIGYELVADAFGVTGYLNGDDTDAMQNIGGEYSYNIGAAKVTAGANYNIDAEDFAPNVGVAFAF